MSIGVHYWLKVGAVALMAIATNPIYAGGPDKPKNIVQTAIAAGQFNTLVKAVEAAQLVDTLSGPGPFTVFAPTDEAFAKLPEGALASLLKKPDVLKSVLLQHVVPGKVMAADVVKLKSAKTALGQSVSIDTAKGVRVDNANVVKTDIAASNGVIHVIDTVIMPANDILEAARAAGSFKTLLTAIEAAGLSDTLRSAGPFTVFAPTDDAFAKLPKGTLESLLKNKEKLASVLTYHVVSGKVMASDVVKLKDAKTVQGQSVKIDASNGVKVNNASVVTTDVSATNGVIHVIDTVLLPPDTKLGAANRKVGRSIELAIERGVPMFNAGHAEACAAVYEIAAATILDTAGDQLDSRVKTRLTRGLRDARQAHNMSERAWTLRHAFDDVLAAERGMMAMTATR